MPSVEEPITSDSDQQDGARVIHIDLAHRRKSIEVYLDFQWKTLVQALDTLMKAVGFYFLVLLGVTGAIYQSKLQGTELHFAVVATVALTTLIGIIVLALAYGVVRGVADLRATAEEVNSELFFRLALDKYFARARRVAFVVLGCTFAILILILVVVYGIKFRVVA